MSFVSQCSCNGLYNAHSSNLPFYSVQTTHMSIMDNAIIQAGSLTRELQQHCARRAHAFIIVLYAHISPGVRLCATTGLIHTGVIPALYDTSGNISLVQLAWSECMDPLQLQRGSSSLRLTPLWCWTDMPPACTTRTGTCLSSLSL